MTLEILTGLYFIFFFVTNSMVLEICYKIMDECRFPKFTIYIAAFLNSTVFTIIAYGFNQLPTITYLMLLIGGIIEFSVLFKNHFYGILMCSFISTIYLVCVESITISSGALILNSTLGDITHNHMLLFSHIVISWFICMVISICINKLVPAKYIKIINQNKEQVLFVLGFLFAATTYLTLNSFIYANADNFDPLYLPLHQIITPLTWLVVISLSIILLIRFDYLHGYKVKSDILEKTLEAQKSELDITRDRADRDSLVSAFNKAATKTKVDEYLTENAHSAFFILDVDNFKSINDKNGHPFGDKVLVYLYKRILHAIRSDDLVGRIGGDEFVIFIKDISNLHIVKSKAKSLCKYVNVPFTDENGVSVNISISVGISISPANGTNFEELYHKADIALYTSKHKGKNTFTIYSDDETKV